MSFLIPFRCYSIYRAYISSKFYLHNIQHNFVLLRSHSEAFPSRLVMSESIDSSVSLPPTLSQKSIFRLEGSLSALDMMASWLPFRECMFLPSLTICRTPWLSGPLSMRSPRQTTWSPSESRRVARSSSNADLQPCMSPTAQTALPSSNAF